MGVDDKQEKKIEWLLAQQSYPEELGLDLTKPKDRTRWFFASALFAKRISSKIAMKTFRLLDEEGLTEPGAIMNAGWDRLVELLDSGGYVRYDFSTADRLLEISARLKESSLEEMRSSAKDQKDLEEKLLELKGVGPKAVQIFLRELRHVWNVDVPISDEAKKAAKIISIDLRTVKLAPRDLAKLESVMVKLWLEKYKRKKSRATE